MVKEKKPADGGKPTDYASQPEPGNTPPEPPEIPTGSGDQNGLGSSPGFDSPGHSGSGSPGNVVCRVSPELLMKAAGEAVNISMPAEKKIHVHQLMSQLTGVEIASGNIGRKARVCIIVGCAVALAIPASVSTFRNLREQRKREINNRGQDRSEISRSDTAGGSGSDNGNSEGATVPDMAGHVARFR